MTRLDRYLLHQLMALFGFFALVLVSVYWVNRAVLLFDRLISDGQTAWVVLEFTALSLPYVIRVVLPVAAFAATVYAINRMSQESELVVMQATGASPMRLARPVLVFGLIVAILMGILVHWLVPASRAALADRQAQISENVTARFLVEGSFQHPSDGITIYIRQISERGELLDLFLSDSRAKTARTTYTAEKALIVKSDTGPKLIMFDGMAQTLRLADDSLAVTRFSNFTYDIGALIAPGVRKNRGWDELPTTALIAPTPETLERAKSTLEVAVLTLNERIAQPLLAPVAALLGFATLMLGRFSRFGIWRQIGMAVIGLILLQFITNGVTSAARSTPQIWPLVYLPALFGGLSSVIMLWWAGRPRALCPRRAPPPDESAPA